MNARTAFSGLIAEALASFCELTASCGYAPARSGYTASPGRLATWPLASASRWLGTLARAWVAGLWARHTKTYLQSLNPNTQFIMEPLAHGIGGKEFPELISYLNSGRKAVIHCRRLDDVLRVFLYLWNSLPANLDRLTRIQMYHSLRSVEDNEEILRLLEEDPRCQVVIGTIALTDLILSMGIPPTVGQLWQEKGRVGRDPDTAARGVVFYEPSALAQAQNKSLSRPIYLQRRK
ncbi:hypothetical protein B0H14DRAFT_2578602 [Mycena olivaceomarginata]|nr:hypothetical protein B0H14DRAFT_2578602 [Mycena olivaceomarginata]